MSLETMPTKEVFLLLEDMQRCHRLLEDQPGSNFLDFLEERIQEIEDELTWRDRMGE